MQRILFVWELGANFGHLARLIPLAQEQRALGREVLFAVNNIHIAKRLLDPIDFECVLAPKVAYERHRRIAANHTELLMNCGYSNPESLQKAVGEWLVLFNHFQPSLLAIDHSPTALLANKVSKIAVIQVGSGFEIPPSDYWPDYFAASQTLQKNPEKYHSQETQSIQSHMTLLNNMNHAIKHYGMGKMQSIVDLYQDCHQVFITFEELDHYPTRAKANYIGPLYNLDDGEKIAWQNIKGKKIFIYAWSGLSGLSQLMLALAELDVEVIARIPDINEAAKILFTKPNIRIFTETLQLKDLMAKADLLITHSGFATVSAFLSHGVPVMIVPDTIERLLVGQQVQSLGAGLLMGSKRQKAHFTHMIVRMLFEPNFKAESKQFAKKYLHWQPEHPIKTITCLMNNIISQQLQPNY